MNSQVLSYPFKLGQVPEIQIGSRYLLELTQEVTQLILEQFWTERWIDQLGVSSKKAYKVLDEKQISQLVETQGLYLPSRIKRCITESAGRIIRSQYERRECFNDVKPIIELLGVDGELDVLVRHVVWTLQFTQGKYYKWQLIRQTLRLFRRWELGYSVDPHSLAYSHLVKPRFHNLMFTLAPDDGQVLKIKATRKKLSLEFKLPKKRCPSTRADWKWCQEKLNIPRKLRRKFGFLTPIQPKRPDLRLFTLKKGNKVPVLQFAWEFQALTLNVAYFRLNRKLAVDLGERTLMTSVVGDAGSQVTPPMFHRISSQIKQKITRRYQQITHLQTKLEKYPAQIPGQNRRRRELTRLHHKNVRNQKEQLHLGIKALIDQALWFGCRTIVIEDLRSYQPPRGKKALSRRLSEWFRGKFAIELRVKALLVGLTVHQVPAHWTSSYCPRCGQKGHKIPLSNSKQANSTGRYFWCSNCNYRADRDYIAALNIYRVSLLPKKRRYCLPSTPPVLYMRTVTPPHRTGGNPSQV